MVSKALPVAAQTVVEMRRAIVTQCSWLRAPWMRDEKEFYTASSKDISYYCIFRQKRVRWHVSMSSH